MPSRPSYLSTVAAHLASLGLAEGESIPKASDIARAVGITKGGVKRLLRELREAGVLHEDTRTPGAPPIVHYPDILAALGTPEGMAQYRQGRQDAKDDAAAVADAVDVGGAVEGDGGAPVAPTPPPARKAVSLGGGSPEAWQLVIGRFDRIVAALEGGEEATRELLVEVRALPGRIAQAVTDALGGVRVPTQTPRTADPNTARMAAALVTHYGSAAKAGAALAINPSTLWNYARSKRQAPEVLAHKIAERCRELKIE